MAKEKVMCSPFHGQLIDASGAPAAGITVERSWNWAFSNEKGADQAVTDGEGRFSFPKVTRTGFFSSILPHTPSILQQVTAKTETGDVLLYEVDKATYDEDAELIYRPMKGPGVNLVCRLDQEPSIEGRPFWGTCVPAPGFETE